MPPGFIITYFIHISNYHVVETFRPIAVRLDCQWHEAKQVDAAPRDNTKPNTNTFSVPEDEDEVVEIVEYKAAVSIQKENHPTASDSPVLSYGSDMSRPLDLTSPLTSPEVKASQLPKLPSPDVEQVDELPSESRLNASSPLNIQSSPYSLHSVALDQAEIIGNSFDSDGEGSISESEESVGEETRGIFEEESGESEDDQYESSDSEEQVPSFSVFDVETSRPMAMFNDSESVNDQADQADLPAQDAKQAVDTQSSVAPAQPHICETDSNLAEHARINTDSAQYTVSWPEYLMPRVPSPSDKAMAKPMGTIAPAPAYQPYSDYSSSLDLWPSNQVPSHQSYTNAVNLANSYGSISANESFPFGPHRSSGYLRHLAHNLMGEGQASAGNDESFEGMETRQEYQDTGKSEITSEIEKPAEASKTRVSIADIVEWSPSSVSNKLKRKATEIDEGAAHDSKETNSSQISLPDAQPRVDLQSIDLTQLPVCDVESINNVRSNGPQERPRKRIQTKRVYTFMKYATIATMGAVVGSVGTIAGLASLPTDFFN